MLNKTKLNLSVVLLMIGIGFIPTGIIANGYFRDQVFYEVSNLFKTIENSVSSELETEYIGLGIAQVLPSLVEQEITNLEEEVIKFREIRRSLLYVKNLMLENLPSIINNSRAATLISDTIDFVRLEYILSTSFTIEELFNNYTFKDDYLTDIEGISEFITGGTSSLGYTEAARTRLLDGRTAGGITYPGIKTDLAVGSGISDWLQFYSLAELDLGNRTLMQSIYNCTWTQLQDFSEYITSHLWNIVSEQYSPLNLEEFAELEFYRQWSNGSIITTGIDIRELNENITGRVVGVFEIGCPKPSNISLESSLDLWDTKNSSSFVNDTGISRWLTSFEEHNDENHTMHNELRDMFNLSDVQMSLIYNWLFNAIKQSLGPNIFALPLPNGYGITTIEYAAKFIYEQWANGTIVEEGIDLGANVKGFEVGVPTKSNISFEIANFLFNKSLNISANSFTNINGILKWIEAEKGNTTAKTELINSFSLSTPQMDLLLDWLFTRFRYDVVPAISYNLIGQSLNDLARFEFRRQWANGTLYHNGFDFGPAFGIQSISGWEIGIPIKTKLNTTVVDLLWDKDDPFSLVNDKGIAKWFKAMKVENTFNNLQHYYMITSEDIENILVWIKNMKNEYIIDFTETRSGLNLDFHTLGSNIYFGFTIAGFILIALGACGLILYVFTKRR